MPSSSLVRGHGEKVGSASPVLDNSAKYNDFVPMVYGTGWLHAPVIFARNDGNLTHMEVLLGQGVIDGVLKVVVSDVEIPIGVSGTDMTATGWYNSLLGAKCKVLLTLISPTARDTLLEIHTEAFPSFQLSCQTGLIADERCRTWRFCSEACISTATMLTAACGIQFSPIILLDHTGYPEGAPAVPH